MMRSLFVVTLYCVFLGKGCSRADLDLFSDVAYNSNDDEGDGGGEVSFPYDGSGAGLSIESTLPWDLYDDQNDSFLADTGIIIDDCASKSLEPVGKPRLRAREGGPVCGTQEPQEKKATAPFWQLQDDPRGGTDLTLTLEEFSCNVHGYEFAVCDSGNMNDLKPMVLSHFILEYCDLCEFAPGASVFPLLFFFEIPEIFFEAELRK
jgi:hypothetical protein